MVVTLSFVVMSIYYENQEILTEAKMLGKCKKNNMHGLEGNFRLQILFSSKYLGFLKIDVLMKYLL